MRACLRGNTNCHFVKDGSIRLINAALVICYFCVVFVACKVLIIAVVLQGKMQNTATIKFRRCIRTDGSELLLCLVQAKIV